MGLAAPKNKTKIGNDPNNTKWTRSTTGFGHRIMSSQGWTPGSLLGAKNAAHADMLTAASASHIKVSLKDDTLGLGARLGRQGEQTGLDAFKGLLGRLNGKSEEELKKDESKLEDVRLARYASLKFPPVRFVRAGLLVQEKEPESTSAKQEKKSRSDKKKRSKSADDESSSDSDARKLKKSKRSKSKSKKSRSKEGSDAESGSETKEKKKSKKRKAESEDPEKVSPAVQTAAPPRARLPMGRQFTRARHIAQKRKAIMDDKSLNEIFMIKA